MTKDPITVAARRIACLASNGRGISINEAASYIRNECGDVAKMRSALEEIHQRLSQHVGIDASRVELACHAIAAAALGR
jgi:hypothetical protein